MGPGVPQPPDPADQRLTSPCPASAARSSAACSGGASGIKLAQGKCKEPRKLLVHFGQDAPVTNHQDVPVWIGTSGGLTRRRCLADARSAGTDSPVLHIFIPKSQAEALKKRIAEQDAAKGTLDFKGVPSTREGLKAREAMNTRLSRRTTISMTLVKEIIDSAKVYQGGGNERLELTLLEKVQEAAKASLDRMFPDLTMPMMHAGGRSSSRHGVAPTIHLRRSITRTRSRSIRSAPQFVLYRRGEEGEGYPNRFADAPFWPRRCGRCRPDQPVRFGTLGGVGNGVPRKPKELDQNKIPVTDFRVETATIAPRPDQAAWAATKGQTCLASPTKNATAPGFPCATCWPGQRGGW